ITTRTPPKLLAEVIGLQKKGDEFHAGSFFRAQCKAGLPDLAEKSDLPLGQFLLCGPKPIKLEERSALLTRAEAEKLKPEEREEIIKVFVPGDAEPKSIVDIDGSLIKHLSDHSFGINRLYVADVSREAAKRLPKLVEAVQKWTHPA